MLKNESEGAVYVHFPYCTRKCPYCDFASQAALEAQIPHEAYARAVVREAQLRGGLMEPVEVTSLYLGGGTPSLWAPEVVTWLVARLREVFQIDSSAEVTIECNPSSFSPERASMYRRAGINRVSMGVQSTRDAHLRFLGRVHDAATAVQALRVARAAGFERVSADLMIGLPDQRPGDAVAQAEELVNEGVSHVSSYMLTIEPSTPFGEAAKAGQLPFAEEGDVARAYLEVSRALRALGFEHYEVSSFSRPGQRSRHNMAVWRGGSYVGLGAGAVGAYHVAADGRRLRMRNTADAARYIQAIDGSTPSELLREGQVVADFEQLTADIQFQEGLMLGLRVAEGVDVKQLGERFGVPGWTRDRRRAAAALARNGRVELEGDWIRIPPEAWLWERDTIVRLL